MNRETDMTRILKRVALFTGFAIVAISIQFSFDGFDQSVSGSNSGYTTLAILIGYTLAIVFNVIEFIFGTNYKELNWTLRGIGVFAYVYSIYTNYLGIKHLLGADEFIAWSLAVVMDVYPEPAIAWAFGEAMAGDFLGNLGKIAFGEKEKPQTKYSHSEYKPKHKPDHATQNPVGFRVVNNGLPSRTKLASPIFNPKYTDRYKENKKPNGGFSPQNYKE